MAELLRQFAAPGPCSINHPRCLKRVGRFVRWFSRQHGLEMSMLVHHLLGWGIIEDRRAEGHGVPEYVDDNPVRIGHKRIMPGRASLEPLHFNQVRLGGVGEEC